MVTRSGEREPEMNFLGKPFQPAELARTVRDLLDAPLARISSTTLLVSDGGPDRAV